MVATSNTRNLALRTLRQSRGAPCDCPALARRRMGSRTIESQATMRMMKVLVRQGANWTALAAHAYGGEQDLQELLFSAPGILSATQFGGPEFIVAAREFGLPGSGSTDLVAVAAGGSSLIAECKLATNDA